ncbi:MAG: 3-dehydroquinate dehydratase [Acetobacteraceae bacterium]|nr:3-dehydroquinate dehydratase [Acetobacteraceae bacterium]
MSKSIFILNGPNLNLLGQREPDIYGHTTLADIEARCIVRAAALGHTVDFRQSNYEGALVEFVHDARLNGSAIIINPAGYTFTSVALMDALKMFDGPKIELHISNVHKREAVYHTSLMSAVVTGLVVGMGAYGYELAVDAVANFLANA